MPIVTDTARSYFYPVDIATKSIIKKWKKRKEIDALIYALDVLFFRNTEIYRNIRTLVLKNQFNCLEILIRSFYEGFVTFEWCLLDKKERSMRFRVHCIKNVIESVNLGVHFIKPKTKKIYEELLQYAKNEGWKNLPNFKQMVEEIIEKKKYPAFQPYGVYKKLSSMIHCRFEDWEKFEPTNIDNPLFEKHQRRVSEKIWLVQVSATLQCASIKLVGEWDDYLKYDGIEKLSKFYVETEIVPVKKK